MLDPSLVGTEYWAASVLVEAGAVGRFAEAVGDDARRRGARGLEVPSAFLLTLVPLDAFSKLLGPALCQVFESECQLEQLRPVLAGDRLSVSSRIVDVVRHGGALGTTEVVTLDDEGLDGDTGGPVYRARRVYAVIGVKETP